MSLIIHVGTDEDLPPKPKNFPRCGNWPTQYSDAEPCPDGAPSPHVLHPVILGLVLWLCLLVVNLI